MRVDYIQAATDPLINIAAEQQLLGAMLINDKILDQLPSYACSEMFGDPTHAELFVAIMKRHKDGLLISPVTLRQWADAHPGIAELGGPTYLINLAGSALSTFAFEHYAKLLNELREKRNITAAALRAIDELKSDEETAHVVAGRLEAALAIEAAGSSDGPVSMLKATTQAVARVKAAQDGEPDRRVKSGIAALDKIVPGMGPGELIILAGRPSMGKSAVAIELALNVARSGGGVCFASLEMPSDALALRAISQATARARNAVNYSEMIGGQLDESSYHATIAGAQSVAGLPIQFLPAHYRDIGALYAGAKRSKALLGDDCGLKLLVVDYLQLLRAPGRSRYEQITEVSIALKSLAMLLEIPVVALSQLSRNVEQRDDKRPQLSDIRESGQLEQDADTIIFTYRDGYYLEREEPDLRDLEEHATWAKAMDKVRHRLDLIVGKQRQGPIGTARFMFNPSLNLFWEP